MIKYFPEMVQESEEWRPVEAFPDYAVSSLGRVKRIVAGRTSRAGRVLRPHPAHGYLYVHLTKCGAVSACRINRLVCIAFHGQPPTPKHQAAHNDGSRDNNRFQNLRWASASENMRDKSAHGTMPTGDRNGARLMPQNLARGMRNGKHTKPECTPRGEKHHASKLCEEAVRAIRSDPRPQRAIAAAHGVTKCAIAGIKSGKTWTHVA